VPAQKRSAEYSEKPLERENFTNLINKFIKASSPFLKKSKANLFYLVTVLVLVLSQNYGVIQMILNLYDKS